VTESHYDGSADRADASDDDAAAQPDPAADPDVTAQPGAAAQPDAAADPDAAAQPDATAEPDEAAPAADPRVRDAVRRLDDLSELPPAEHVEVYEAVHSSLQESLAEASRQADEAPDGGSAS
jgi:hypothetical protein